MMKKITKKITKKIMGVFFILMTACVIAVGYPLSVYAEEGLEHAQTCRFMKALQQVDAKAEPDDNAETVFGYEEGDYVYVTGETETGWLIVDYRGQTGYIDASSAVLEAEEIDIEALDEEMAAQEMRNKLIAEEMERYYAESRRSKIWGAVIVLLVVGIFSVGIISTVGSEKRENEDDDIIDLA